MRKRNEKDNKNSKAELAPVVIPALITGAVGIIVATITYFAGMRPLQYSISVTQTAEAKTPPLVETVFVTQIVEVTPTPDLNKIAIESFPMTVSAYLATEDDPAGYESHLRMIYDPLSSVIYRFKYVFPENSDGYAGLMFNFSEPIDISGYENIQLTIEPETDLAQCTLYMTDIDTGGTAPCVEPFDSDSGITLVGDGSKKTLTIPLSVFEANLKVVAQVYFVITSPSTTAGEISFKVSDVQFTRP